MTADRLDAARDAAALLRTFHEGDREGREILLDYGDTRAIAEVLAAVLHGTVTATYRGCRGCAAEFVTTWQEALRAGIPEPAKGTPSVTPTEQEAIEAARRPVSCRSCGRTYAGSAAYQVAHDPGWPGCVPPDVAGLIEVDGVWCVPGSVAR